MQRQKVWRLWSVTIWEISVFNLRNPVDTASGSTEVWKSRCLTSASSAQVSKAAPPWQPAPPGAGQGTRMDVILSTGDPQRHTTGVGAGGRTRAGSGSRRCRAATCRRGPTSLQHQLWPETQPVRCLRAAAIQMFTDHLS